MADSSKTESATARRREKARSQGKVARSRELTNVCALAGAIATLSTMLHGTVGRWTQLYRSTLDAAATGTIDSNGPVLFWSTVEVFHWIVPILLSAMALSLAAGLAQGGLGLATEAMAPSFSRLDPAAKLKSMFSAAAMSNLLKSLVPFAAIVCIGVQCFHSHWDSIVRASSYGLRAFAALVGQMVYEAGWKAGLVLLCWSAVDYLFIWRKLESDLKMTKQEVKDEAKDADGNPVIKGRIRRLQRQMRRRQSLKAAATATVVITNPTHYAVGLKYEPPMEAPIVVAKGLDLLAQEIKQLALDNGIMLMENKPLAQALYKSVEVGDAIPAQLYKAVADILVVVFRAQAEARAQEARRRSRNASGEWVKP